MKPVAITLLLLSIGCFAQENANQPTDTPLPKVTKFPETRGATGLDPSLTAPELPKSKLALIGGTVREIDPIRDRMQIEVFGGGKMKIFFDQRSKILRDGAETTATGIKKGDRVYLDTQLLDSKIFARRIQIRNKAEAAEVSGQIIAFNRQTGDVTLQDRLSRQTVNFRVTPQTEVEATSKDRPAGSSQVLQGAIVAAFLKPQGNGPRLASRVQLIASPGDDFNFYGTITHIDMRSSILVIENTSDRKLYEVKFSPAKIDSGALKIGAEASAIARFDGKDYIAQQINLMPSSKKSNSEDEESTSQPKK